MGQQVNPSMLKIYSNKIKEFICFIFAGMIREIFFVILILWPLTVYGQIYTSSAVKIANSAYDDQNPVLTPDGKTLYFTIANHPENVGGKKDPGDIWYSTWTSNQWSAPVHAGSVINDRTYNAIAGFSPDGNEVFLLNHFTAAGSPPSTQGISISSKTQSGWSTPKNIAIPYFLNRSGSISGEVSRDGTVFVFSAESYSTKGAEDIYVSLKDNAGNWTEAINLGPVINSAFQELSPSLSADKKYIYYSSNGRRGYGSFDIYYAERLDNTWLNWSIPANMGSRINTDGRELYYHSYPDKKMAFYTTTQNSDGYGDIKIFSDSLPNVVPASVVKIIAIRRDGPLSNSDKLTTIRGIVTNSRTGQPIVAKLDFKSDSIRTTSSGKQGAYTLQIPSTKVYSIVVEAAGYVGVLEKLDIHTFEMRQVELNFKLQPIEVGATVNLKNVLFQMSSTVMLSESYDELNVVVDLLRSNPKIEIELAGHTDSRGDARMNHKLSQSRVDAVKSYLVSKGISGRRIQGKGYGGKKPIASSDTEENRKLNRRVEFTIVKD